VFLRLQRNWICGELFVELENDVAVMENTIQVLKENKNRITI
jgi:hypothetical protein